MKNEHHLFGDSERAEGGELIDWTNDQCYWATRPITTFGMPQTSKICKDPFKPDGNFFKAMHKKLDERETSHTP